LVINNKEKLLLFITFTQGDVTIKIHFNEMKKIFPQLV